MTRRGWLLLPAFGPAPAVFTLELRRAGAELSATLRNRSRTPQRYLHHRLIQPVTLNLKTAAGQTVAPVDRRANAKFDATPYRHLYQVLAPGASARLLRGALGPGSLEWGPFTWQDLPGGRYTVSAHFEHQSSQWVDDETGQTGAWPEMWRGILESAGLPLLV